jgi:hypothetical protein
MRGVTWPARLWINHIQNEVYAILYGLTPKIPFLETKNWSIAVWAACVKKNKKNSIFSFRQVNYIFHKLSVNTKHAQFQLCMSPWRIFVENKY